MIRFNIRIGWGGAEKAGGPSIALPSQPLLSFIFDSSHIIWMAVQSLAPNIEFLWVHIFHQSVFHLIYTFIHSLINTYFPPCGQPPLFHINGSYIPMVSRYTVYLVLMVYLTVGLLSDCSKLTRLYMTIKRQCLGASNIEHHTLMWN